MGVVLLRFATSTAGAGGGSRVRSEMPRRFSVDDLALAAQGKSLRRSSKLATAILFLGVDLQSVARKPFHADAGREHADGQQRNELAPADGTAHLNGTAEDFGVDPGRVSARRQCELGLFCSIVRRRGHRQQTAAIIVANRKRPASAVAAVSGSYRWASQMKAIRRTNPAVTIPNTTARSAQTKRPELRPVLARARSSRYFRQPPIQRFLPGLTCPHGPEQKAKRQRQSQRRIGALLQGLVDRVGHIVADFADRLDCFP